MKQRFIKGWTVRRLLFLLGGAAIAVQSLLNKEWPGILAGSYFAAMGLFGWGCAGNNCGITPPPEATRKEEISYEEVS